MPDLRHNTITLEAFRKVLSNYDAAVPEKLKELDVLRYETIPAAMKQRAKEAEENREEEIRRGEKQKVHPESKVEEYLDYYLTKEEVLQLVEWKLKHGTFRPSLLKLVSSNHAEEIETTTRQAYALLTQSVNYRTAPVRYCPHKNTMAALRHLCVLRGIGPATASLLLSVHAGNRWGAVPFFSDELFRWMMWDGKTKDGRNVDEKGGKGKGWKRKIGYTEKEYEMMLQKAVDSLTNLDHQRRQLVGAEPEVKMVEVEKVAWVLGRCEWDLDDLEGEFVRTEGERKAGEKAGMKLGEKQDDTSGTKTAEEPLPVKPKTMKRKGDEDVSPPPPRRSTRRRMETEAERSLSRRR
ncbi:hypothetical protein GQ43DRAFT_482241 [Delitschia confertaspora ATCC 74209]|uniref:Uncharacterized protein n=1 Tax=Delitschia confertaspora ATCC 74209 TaxID=1513339 RepID=A0A9P4JMU9_9PLEO|nr:hypothetical protein GQ43DRAFT_482241 [Delitschia confertaspora ATCC 74209]